MSRWGSPLQRLTPRARWSALGALLIGVVAVGVPMASLEKTMKAHGYGIVALETAGPDKAAAILTTWGAAGRDAAHDQILIDYLWLLLYAGALAVACIIVGEGLGRAWSRVGVILSYLALFAGVLDAIENTALLALLSDRDLTLTSRIAQLAAYPKFVLVIAAGLFALPGMVVLLMKRTS